MVGKMPVKIIGVNTGEEKRTIRKLQLKDLSLTSLFGLSSHSRNIWSSLGQPCSQALISTLPLVQALLHHGKVNSIF